jgi:hypothetical protein
MYMHMLQGMESSGQAQSAPRVTSTSSPSVPATHARPLAAPGAAPTSSAGPSGARQWSPRRWAVPLGAITALTGLWRTRGLAPARTELFLPASPEVNSLAPAAVPAATGPAITAPAATGPEHNPVPSDVVSASATAPEPTVAGDCWDEDGDCWDLVDA